MKININNEGQYVNHVITGGYIDGGFGNARSIGYDMSTGSFEVRWIDGNGNSQPFP